MKIVELDSTSEGGDSVSPEVLKKEREEAKEESVRERSSLELVSGVHAHLISEPRLDDRRLSGEKSDRRVSQVEERVGRVRRTDKTSTKSCERERVEKKQVSLFVALRRDEGKQKINLQAPVVPAPP